MANTMGIVRVACCSAPVTGVVLARITSGCNSTISLASARIRSTSPTAQRKCYPQIAALGPAEALEFLHKRLRKAASFRIGFGIAHQHADSPKAVCLLLRARCELP